MAIGFIVPIVVIGAIINDLNEDDDDNINLHAIPNNPNILPSAEEVNPQEERSIALERLKDMQKIQEQIHNVQQAQEIIRLHEQNENYVQAPEIIESGEITSETKLSEITIGNDDVMHSLHEAIAGLKQAKIKSEQMKAERQALTKSFLEKGIILKMISEYQAKIADARLENSLAKDNALLMEVVESRVTSSELKKESNDKSEVSLESSAKDAELHAAEQPSYETVMQ
jgi:hypothetical protein